MMMGDLVLLQTEIEPVMKALGDGGVGITAVHNHLLRSDPQVMYVHYVGMGDVGQLATVLKKALGNSKTPLGAPQQSAPEVAPWFKQPVEQALGRHGHRVGWGAGSLRPACGGRDHRRHGDSAEHGHRRGSELSGCRYQPNCDYG